MILLSTNQWKCDYNSDEWKKRGEDCSSDARMSGMVRAYMTVQPDIICVQEASEHMSELMMNELLKHTEKPVYRYISGGDTPIAYRQDKLKLKESGFFLFDEKVPGFDGCYNNCDTKSYCYGVFEQNEKCFAVMSVHLWWMKEDPASPKYYPHSGEARAYQLNLAMDKMEEISKKYDCPAIIMGDFNAVYNSLCISSAFERGWKEAHDVAVEYRNETRGHHYCKADCYRHDEPGEFKDAIDHIIIKDADRITVNKFDRIMPEWYDCLSDHYPLYIDADIK